MIEQIYLSTSRLILRPFSLVDATELQRLAGDKVIADTTVSIPHPYNLSIAQNQIKTHEQDLIQGKAVHFAIALKETNQFIGAIELRDIETDHLNAELSFWIGTAFWGKGFATEAATCILEYGFKHLQLNRIYAYHMVRNPASGKVMEKLGMRLEGILRERVRKWNVFEDVNLYAILKRDW